MMIGFDDVGFVFVFERQAKVSATRLIVENCRTKSDSPLDSRHFVEHDGRRLALAAFGEHLRDRSPSRGPSGRR
jgi:hypothetical protein